MLQDHLHDQAQTYMRIYFVYAADATVSKHTRIIRRMWCTIMDNSLALQRTNRSLYTRVYLPVCSIELPQFRLHACGSLITMLYDYWILQRDDRLISCKRKDSHRVRSLISNRRYQRKFICIEIQWKEK